MTSNARSMPTRSSGPEGASAPEVAGGIPAIICLAGDCFTLMTIHVTLNLICLVYCKLASRNLLAESLIKTLKMSLRGTFDDQRESKVTKQSPRKINGLLRRIELPPVVRFSSQ